MPFSQSVEALAMPSRNVRINCIAASSSTQHAEGISVVQQVVARDDQNMSRHTWEGIRDDPIAHAFP
jgi:hypothetical protein